MILSDQGSVFTVGISTTDVSTLRSGDFFTVGIFSQLGFPPPISGLSDRGSVFTVGIPSTDLCALRSVEYFFTVGIFSQLGFPPLFAALPCFLH